MPLYQLLYRLINGNTRIGQNPSCPILNLPIEIVLLIVERLPQYQQLILSQTCYPLRLIIRKTKSYKIYPPLISIKISDKSMFLLWLAAVLISGPAIDALSSIVLTGTILR